MRTEIGVGTRDEDNKFDLIINDSIKIRGRDISRNALFMMAIAGCSFYNGIFFISAMNKKEKNFSDVVANSTKLAIGISLMYSAGSTVYSLFSGKLLTDKVKLINSLSTLSVIQEASKAVLF